MSGVKLFPWRNKDELNKADPRRAAVRVMHTVIKFKPLCNSIRCLGWAGVGIPVKRQVIGVAVADELETEFVGVVGGTSDGKE